MSIAMSELTARRPPARRITRHAALIGMLTLVVAGLLLPAAAFGSGGDATAVAKAERLLDALGGKAAFEATHFLRFDFFGFRTHHWDRWTGRYRLEGKNRAGESYVVLFDTDTKDGRAWKDGAELSGEDAAQMLEMAYGAFINDTYWLLMPYKLLDPGVTLRDAGKETHGGTAYDVVELRFDSVGLTPGDTYWAYLDPATGLMDRWAYHLEDWPAEQPNTVWEWRDWQRYGGILLSSVRRNVESGDERPLGNIAVFDQLPDSVFTSPTPVE